MAEDEGLELNNQQIDERVDRAINRRTVRSLLYQQYHSFLNEKQVFTIVQDHIDVVWEAVWDKRLDGVGEEKYGVSVILHDRKNLLLIQK